MINPDDPKKGDYNVPSDEAKIIKDTQEEWFIVLQPRHKPVKYGRRYDDCTRTRLVRSVLGLVLLFLSGAVLSGWPH